MIKIKIFTLSSGAEVLLDDEDYDRIPKTGWYLDRSGNSRTPYVTHDDYGRLHRYILNLSSSDPRVVDHIDRNGLNNQKNNLRVISNSLNKRNQATCSNNKFNFNGVSYEKKNGSHSARIRVNYASNERSATSKRFKTKSKSYSISKYGLNEALRLAVKFRIEKMREFDYFIDERSETIERAVKDPNVDMASVLGIDFTACVE